MKKIILLMLTAILLLNLYGCGMVQAEVPAFTENETAFVSVAAFARSYYTAQEKESDVQICLTLYKSEESGVYELEHITPDNEFVDIPNGLSKSLEKTYQSGFTDVKVTDGYLIFWNDETCKYGLLYTDSPDAARKDLSIRKSQIRKIDTDWYEIDRGGI